MKKINIILLFLSCVNLYSQNGYIEYGYIEAFGIGNAQGPEYNAFLIFNKEKSYYVTAKDSLETTEKINSQQSFENKEDSDLSGAIYNGLKSSKDGDQVFFSAVDKNMYSTFYYDNVDYIKDGEIIFAWTITNETKKIGKFNCSKATTSFRGRDYTAWFTNEIAVPFGPWKLNGLPGLIVEAYDKGKFVYWSLKNFEYPTTKAEVKFEKSTIKYKPYSKFKEFQKIELEKEKERNLIFKKQYPNVELGEPKLNEMFIECE